jgi:hypothetical protein
VSTKHLYDAHCEVAGERILLTYLLNPFILYPTVSRLFFHFDHFTDGRTPRTGDQLVARPLPKHRTTQSQNKHTHKPNIHALCGIGTHDPGFRAKEDSTCLRLLGYRDRHQVHQVINVFNGT